VAAMDATLTARTGAMVESAPTDMCRLVPIRAYRTDPATKAYRPTTAGRLANRAVAIWDGKAMATRVKPAKASAANQEAR
jgi:hypothetical protein